MPLLANRADNNVKLHHQTDGSKHKIKKDHGRAEQPTDHPFTGCNGDDEKEKHQKEEHRGTDESAAADRCCSQTVNDRVEQPRQWKPFM